VRRIAVDTGPLVAFLNARDAHHEWAKNILDGIEPPVYTCEAVVSEACFLVRHLSRGPDKVFELISRGIVRLGFSLEAELPAVRKLMAKYATVPMSVADACLVRMTELDAKTTVLTLDRDFRIYRRAGRQVIPMISPE